MENSHSNSRKWSILLVATLATFINNLDASIVIIGLPQIMRGLNLTMTTGLLVITAFIIVNTVLIVPAGKWADTIGTKPIFILGIIIFTISTILCGIASSGISLIIYRVIQGAGAALASASGTPSIIRAFPKKQLGLALGINATSFIIGAVAGPVVGGVLINEFGWRSLFFVTLPFLIFCAIGGFIVMEKNSNHTKVNTDWAGILTFALGLVSILILLSEGQIWGWTSITTIALFLASVVLWIIFATIELHAKNPLLNFSLLSNKNYIVGLYINLGYCTAYFSLPLLLTVYLQSALHLIPIKAAFIMISLSIPHLILGALGGKLADYFGALRTFIFGVVLAIIGLFILGGNISADLSIPGVVIPLCVISIAASIAYPSLSKIALSAAPKSQAGSASGMFFTIQNLSKALSQTLVILLLEASIPPAVITNAIVGIGDSNNLQIESSLVNSIGSTFRIFDIFFVIALLLGLFLLYSKSEKSIDVPSLELD